jgi:hypothetical protein
MYYKNEIITVIIIPLSVITSYYLSIFFMDKEYLTNLDILLENYCKNQ